MSTQITKRDSVCSVSVSLAVTNDIAILLSFPPPTKMFQFGGFPILTDQYVKTYQEVPLGNLGFQRCMLLAQAYRSLPRPSQATQAKPSPRQHKQQNFITTLANYTIENKSNTQEKSLINFYPLRRKKPFQNGQSHSNK